MKKRYLIPTIAVGSIVVLGAGLYLWSRISPTEIRTEVEIDAPVEDVWEVLTDFEQYPDWNPFIVRAEGEPREGETLKNTLLADGSTSTFEPEVLAADPGEELRWIGRFGVPGIVDGEHFFLLEPTDDGGTRLVQGEKFTGMLVPFAGGSIDVEAEFDAMNDALKARVEESAR